MSRKDGGPFIDEGGGFRVSPGQLSILILSNRLAVIEVALPISAFSQIGLVSLLQQHARLARTS